LPFMVAQTIVMLLLIVFPQIVMWPLQMMTR
jgi:TRAP-type C4-dicarboxylate transport system permease large subunit